MRKIILFILVMVLFASCVTQRKCNAKFPTRNDTVRIEHVRDSLVIKDTTVYVTIPGARVIDSVLIPCPAPPSGYVPKRVHAETSFAYAEAWWSYPVIKLILVQKDTTIARQLNDAIKERYYWKTLYEKVHITPDPVKYIPKIYKDAMSICIVVFALTFVFAGWKLYGFFKK